MSYPAPQYDATLYCYIFLNTSNLKDDIRKVFQFFNKDYHVTLQIDSVIIFWDSLSEFENKIVFVREYDGICGMNYTEKKTSFDKCKKEIYKRLG